MKVMRVCALLLFAAAGELAAAQSAASAPGSAKQVPQRCSEVKVLGTGAPVPSDPEYLACREAEAKRQQREALVRAGDGGQSTAFLRKRAEECGDDFRTPRIGMTLERARHCVANFQLVAQANRKDGVVSTYKANSMYLHMMNGVVVAWEGRLF